MSRQIKQGRLKIFFGYAPGTEKTGIMLKSALRTKKAGTFVAIGCVESAKKGEIALLLEKGWPDFAKGLERSGRSACKLYIDDLLRAHPDIAVVENLAHANPPGARHAKRYQDVRELLHAGIDVYTTADITQIESLKDTVEQIVGVTIPERIPDPVFDRADQVEWIDVEPPELLETWKSQEEYRAFAREDILTALKELALRRCADRIAYLSNISGDGERTPYFSDEHVLVCLSPSPSNSTNIRAAARIALAFHATFTALFVQTPDYEAFGRDDKDRLKKNMRLAEQLGAKIEIVYGEDIVYQISEFARKFGVTKLLLGKSVTKRSLIFVKPTFSERLSALCPNLDIYIIPDGTAPTKNRFSGRYRFSVKPELTDVLKMVAILALNTCICYVFEALGFDKGNMIIMYILGVLIVSVITRHKLYGLLDSVLSVLAFNFFFTEPRFTLLAARKEYLISLLVMFVSSVITGSLAARLKKNAEQSARVTFRTKVLIDTMHLLRDTESEEEIFDITAGRLNRLFGKDVILYPASGEKLGCPRFYPCDADAPSANHAEPKEDSVAAWVYANNKQAGKGTDTFAAARCLYLTIRSANMVYGVVGIVLDASNIDYYERDILLSVLDECALSLESKKNAREKEEATLLAQNEQLQANLLRSVSHDLRTPLTSISGNASNLLTNGNAFDEQTRQKIYTDIYNDAMWLIVLVENILSITKLDGRKGKLNLTSELVGDVIEEALKHIRRVTDERRISVELSDDLLLARMDVRLIIQVIINLVDNAMKYTQEGTDIQIRAYRADGMVHIRISDYGEGIPDEKKKKVFDMFYSGSSVVSDSRKSLGLGLSLCRSIVAAHGGSITLTDNVPHGAVFDFTLQEAEVANYE